MSALRRLVALVAAVFMLGDGGVRALLASSASTATVTDYESARLAKAAGSTERFSTSDARTAVAGVDLVDIAQRDSDARRQTYVVADFAASGTSVGKLINRPGGRPDLVLRESLDGRRTVIWRDRAGRSISYATIRGTWTVWKVGTTTYAEDDFTVLAARGQAAPKVLYRTPKRLTPNPVAPGESLMSIARGRVYFSTVVYRRGDPRVVVVAVPLRGGPPRVIARGLGATAAGRYLTFAQDTPRGFRVIRRDLQTGLDEVVFRNQRRCRKISGLDLVSGTPLVVIATGCGRTDKLVITDGAERTVVDGIRNIGYLQTARDMVWFSESRPNGYKQYLVRLGPEPSIVTVGEGRVAGHADLGGRYLQWYEADPNDSLKATARLVKVLR